MRTLAHSCRLSLLLHGVVHLCAEILQVMGDQYEQKCSGHWSTPYVPVILPLTSSPMQWCKESKHRRTAWSMRYDERIRYRPTSLSRSHHSHRQSVWACLWMLPTCCTRLAPCAS